MPINTDLNKLEISYGVNFEVNFEVNYKINLTEDISLTLNQLFFYTNVDSPLMFTPFPNNIYQFAILMVI